MKGRIAFVISALLFAADSTARSADTETVVWKNGAVAADHPLASQAGVEILRQGGNVVDAAVAVGFAQSVLRPGSSGLGGGGFMVIWNAETRSAIALDYRERAPLAASRNMFLTPGKDGSPRSSRTGAHAVAVPGHVAGLCHALKKFGTMSLRQVLAPAIRLASEGVLLDEHELDARQSLRKRLPPAPDRPASLAPLSELYLLGDQPLTDEIRFFSPQKKALLLIADQGRDAFYRGEMARSLVKFVRNQGGLLTVEDLAAMDVVERKPLTCRFEGSTIITMPPPSSGGVALIECLHILQSLESGKLDSRIEKLGHNSSDYLHLLTETMKHAFADRAEFLGDADFAEVPVERLISPDYAGVLAGRIRRDRTRPPKDYGRFLPVNDSGTTHFSVIDADGNAVACTETINTSFGSKLVEPRFGIVLNNEMDDFAAQPGRPNAFGLIQSEANCVEPRKKPLSSMTPTIVVQDGCAVMAVGASGGPRIISGTLQVLLNRLRFKLSVREAVDRPRIHHQWLPELLYVEKPIRDETRATLQSRGHTVRQRKDIGVCQAVVRTGKGLEARSDLRKHGRATGY